jgi:sugar O-acyltransferase (sialic acid O-acetyltransferase NeuD family)
MNDLVIFGAGGFAREVAQLALDLIADGAPMRLVGFLSDDAIMHGTAVGGLPVLGDASYLERNSGRYSVALGVGSPAVKRRLATRSAISARGFPSLVHPTVVRSNRVVIGGGVIICAMSVLTVDIELRDFATVNLACTVGHDAILSEYVTLAPAVNVSGNVFIGAGCDVGTGAKVIQGRRLGEWSIIGAGAVVSTDLPANCTAVGVPARSVKQRDQGWQLGEFE